MSTVGDAINVAEVVIDMLATILKVVRAADAGNEAAVDQALMEGQEAIKKEQDRRKFGHPPNSVDPNP